ncbi:MAG TPA: hypothetical protein VK673_21735, partial [Chthoniobacterales bacterium]|nr:hypothetical protein [Chthoniobacterales bacterium]
MKSLEAKEKPIIEAILKETHNLLTSYWGDIVRVRDSKDNVVAISMTYKVDSSGENPVVKVKMGFSRRYHDVSEATVDIGQQEFEFLKSL